LAARTVPLIANPEAGLGRTRRALPRAIMCLERLGWQVRVHLTSRADDTARIAARLCREHDRLLVAGGDGTVHSVLPALAGSQTVLALLPIGMANAAARELRIPRSIPQMCRVATGDKVRAIDLGCANGVPFVLMAGMGFDAAVVHTIKPRLKRLLGPGAYVLNGLRQAARARPSAIRVTADGREFELRGWLAVIANMATYTYFWKSVPSADCADGLLDACIFAPGGPFSKAGQLAAALAGLHLKHPLVRCLSGASLNFECDPALPVQLDGEAAGHTPLRVTAMPRALRVLVP